MRKYCGFLLYFQAAMVFSADTFMAGLGSQRVQTNSFENERKCDAVLMMEMK
jgi:hypothetical protein